MVAVIFACVIRSRGFALIICFVSWGCFAAAQLGTNNSADFPFWRPCWSYLPKFARILELAEKNFCQAGGDMPMVQCT